MSFRRCLFLVSIFSLCALALLSMRLKGRRVPWRVQFLSNETIELRPDAVCAQTLIIFVNSKPENAQRRQVIRETWGHPQVLRPLDVGLAFGLGRATTNDDVQRPLHWESAVFGDAVQQELSGKLEEKVHFLQVVRETCRPSYILNIDDDVFVDPFVLVKEIREFSTQPLQDQSALCLIPDILRSLSSVTESTIQLNPAFLLPSHTLDYILTIGQDIASFEDLCNDDFHGADIKIKHLDRMFGDGNVKNGSLPIVHLGPDVVELSERLWSDVLGKRLGVLKNLKDIFSSL